MAARDVSKKTIARELALLLNRVEKTTELNANYQGEIKRFLNLATKALIWEDFEIPFKGFQAVADNEANEK